MLGLVVSILLILVVASDVTALHVCSLKYKGIQHSALRSIIPGTSKMLVKPRTALWMSSTGRSGSSGSTKLDRKTAQKTETKPTYKEEIEKDWRLILHDDTVHTIQQVCDIVSAACPLCSGPRAYEVTLEVHMTGAGTVAVANKKIITEYTKSLQAAGLTVSMAPDDEFDDQQGEEDYGNEDGGGGGGE